jgi:hypothetical protein
MLSGRRRHTRAHTVYAAVFDVDCAHGRTLDLTEGDHAAGEVDRARHDSPVVCVTNEHVVRLCSFENLGLRIGNRIRRREEADMRIADVGPDADVGIGNRDQRADLPCVIHPEFHDRDIRLVAQLQQRQRQADVIVQIPLVLHDAVRRGQKVRNRVLRRGLARAARNRDHLCRCRFPHRVRQVLQRPCCVVGGNHHGVRRKVARGNLFNQNS